MGFYPPPLGEGGFQSRRDSGVWPPASRFLVGAKTTGQILLKFNMTFLATSASDFLEMLLKFKMAARGQL